MADIPESTKLLPCPFCGGQPQSKTVAIRDGQTLSCRNLKCMAGVAAFNPDAAEKCVAAWNTRAAPPAMDREAVVLLRALLTGYAGQPNQAGEAYKLVDATLSADAKSQREEATTANSPVVPDGWKVVPILPTDQMLHAGGGMIPGTEVDPTAAGIVWCFMLNAAPALSSLSADAIRQGEGLQSAVADTLNAAWALCDDTENGDSDRPSVPRDAWRRLADALDALEAIIPKSEQPCWPGVAARLLAGRDPAISGLEPVPGHAAGCGAHDGYDCDCLATPASHASDGGKA